jgi:2-oxo-4-hydroxy-4-carboxy-5-ureidoimidazoline decarboxylase
MLATAITHVSNTHAFVRAGLSAIALLTMLVAAPPALFAAPPDFDAINKMDVATFVQEFGGIFEKSPWVAEKAWAARPFSSIDDMHQKMFDVIKAAPKKDQIAFLNNHPELAGKEAQAGQMTSDSVAEQASAGLNSLNKDELARLAKFNADYRAKFGFPYMIFVRGHTKEGIFFYFERRLQNDPETELKNALDQVYGITRFRLRRKFGEV